MQLEDRPMEDGARPRPRWVFRGRPGAWDALMANVVTDPSRPVRWPIAPSGPSMADGDTVLLWRSGRGGGIAALCTVIGEPEAQPRPDGPPEVIVGLRIERALGRPISPTVLLADPILRPLAFVDLLETTEHRVTPAQEQQLSVLLGRSSATAGVTGSDAAEVDRGDEPRTSIDVPVDLVPIVQRLLAALGADEAPPVPLSGAAVAQARGGPPAADVAPTEPTEPTEPTALQATQAGELAERHGDEAFTVDQAAHTWRTGVGTARSRIERLLESGLVVRAGFLRSEERPNARPTRGRPPVLYRLAAARVRMS